MMQRNGNSVNEYLKIAVNVLTITVYLYSGYLRIIKCFVIKFESDITTLNPITLRFGFSTNFPFL